MKEKLISLETAILAKEVGCNLTRCECGGFPECICEENDKLRITQSLLQKWLREKHDIHITIMPCKIPSNETKYYKFTGKLKWNWNELFDTYEEALEQALITILNIIR